MQGWNYKKVTKWLVGFIILLALHYAYTRGMNMSVCTHLMDRDAVKFFSGATPHT